MRSYDAVQLIQYIQACEKKLTPQEATSMIRIKDHLSRWSEVTKKDGKELEDIYRRVSGGGDKQNQPFKQYRRR